MKQIISNYTFDPANRTVTLKDFTSVDLSRLALITNVTRSVVLYNFIDNQLNATVSGNVITLTFDTKNMSASDKLRIDYKIASGDPAYEKLIVGNAKTKFRDGFASVGNQPDSSIWTLTNQNNSHTITSGGNSSGSSYLRISLNPLVDDSEVTLTSKASFSMPMRTGFGVSISQRIVGQEIFAGMVGDDGTGSVDYSTTNIADQALATGSNISITSNVATVTLTNHGYFGGDRISIFGCPDSRMNVGPVVITGATKDTFTVPITATNGTYVTTGGFIRYEDPLKYAYNGHGYLWENTTVTNASIVSRRNGTRFRTTGASTQTTTNATQSNTSPYTDAFNSTANFEQYLTLDEASYRSYTSDATSSANVGKFTQGIPDENPTYHIQFRAKTLKGSTIPVARIVSIAKTGTTTATVTTDVAHGLTTSDWVQIYGVKDQTNFPNLTAQTAVASVISSTQFTVVIGTASTTSSTEGAVWRVQGATLAPGVYTSAIQSVTAASNIVTLIGSATWATPLPGEMVYLYGLNSSLVAYEGAYKVLRVSTTTLELTPATGTVADIGTTATGGAAIKMTDVRLHFARVMDYTRLVTEVAGGRGGTSDLNNAIPIYSNGGSVNSVQSTGANTTQWSAAGWGGFLVNDVASAALTVTTTTAAVSPGSVVTIGTYAHSFNVVVTAVSGTNPTLDVGVEESIDNGTNWVRIYDFERITAIGAYTSPLIMAQYGSRYRYVQTVAGTSPSFTRAVNRLQFSSSVPLLRRFIDRSITLTTLNSTTPTYNVEGMDTFNVAFNVGAIVTTAPQLQIEGSEDATNWYAIGTPITAVASSTVMTQLTGALPKFIRGRISTAGVGVTAGYISIKALGR